MLSWLVEKHVRKLIRLLSADLVTPSQGPGHWKLYTMVEVNGAYKHDRYEQVWLKSLHAITWC